MAMMIAASLGRRSFLFHLFPVVLLRGWQQRGVEPVKAIVTEEGQRVVFPRQTWQARELAKRLPLEEPWPAGPDLRKALVRFGLDRDTPPAPIPMPAQIAPDVYLVGQEKVTNLTYLIDCGGKQSGIFTFPPSKVDRRLSDGEDLKLGNKVLQVIHTPGHTPGSACFLLQVEARTFCFQATPCSTTACWAGS